MCNWYRGIGFIFFNVLFLRSLKSALFCLETASYSSEEPCDLSSTVCVCGGLLLGKREDSPGKTALAAGNVPVPFSCPITLCFSSALWADDNLAEGIKPQGKAVALLISLL